MKLDGVMAVDATKSHDRQACRELAASSFRTDAQALVSLVERLDEQFDHAIELILTCRGRIVVSGVGKSGHIGRKIGATFASLGIPSQFVHSTEAFHGDFGMICPGDVVMLISQSGETEDVVRTIPFLRKNHNPIVAITGGLHSRLARHADAVLNSSVEREACPMNLAPTTSTIVALAIGDAIAIAVSQARNFGADDFARYHPGGRLGTRLMTAVKEVMRSDDLPQCAPSTAMRDVLPIISRGRLGIALVLDCDRLVGVVTDGDLRRAMEHQDTMEGVLVSDIMSTKPLVIGPNASVFDADELMRLRKVTALVVQEEDGPVLGVLKVHD